MFNKVADWFNDRGIDAKVQDEVLMVSVKVINDVNSFIDAHATKEEWYERWQRWLNVRTMSLGLAEDGSYEISWNDGEWVSIYQGPDEINRLSLILNDGYGGGVSSLDEVLGEIPWHVVEKVAYVLTDEHFVG